MKRSLTIVGAFFLCMTVFQTQLAKADDIPQGDLKEIMQPYKESYHECLGMNVAKFIKGSDDVNFLVSHVSRLCEQHVEDAGKQLVEMGKSIHFAKGYKRGMREDGITMTTSFILSEKAKSKQ